MNTDTSNQQTRPRKMALLAFLPALLIYALICLFSKSIPGSSSFTLIPDERWVIGSLPAVINLPFVYYLPYDLALILLAICLITVAAVRHEPPISLIVAALTLLGGIGLSLITNAAFNNVIIVLLGTGYSLTAGAIMGAMKETTFRSHAAGQLTVYTASLYTGLAVGAIGAIFINVGLSAGVAVAAIDIIIGCAFGFVAGMIGSLSHRTTL